MLKLNPLNEKKKKKELEELQAAVEKTNHYQWPLVADRAQMAKYMHLCKKRGTNAQKEIRSFIERELKRFDSLFD